MEDKKNITDVTFLIRIRVDSMDRLENLLMVVNFISSHFDTNIHVWETACYNNHILKKLLPQDVSVTFKKDYDPIYHYTKYMNMMGEICRTPLIAVWEADIIVPSEQIIRSIDLLRNQEADFVSPYKNKALDTTRIIRELYFKTRDINILQENKGKMIELYPPNPVGGCFLANREAYINSGMENEKFYGWGREDGERVNRWRILGYKYKRVTGPLFHLTHERGKNSTFHAEEQKNTKLSELYLIASMSKMELENEVNSWVE